MGTIYRSYDTLLDREVAIKVLSARASQSYGSQGRARFLREAQAAAQLNHPNIVSIYDAGEANGTPFIVMELIDGTDLYNHMPESIPEVIHITRQICEALQHAHSHGIVHRDLKPENVLITKSGNVKLTDFGLARSLSSRLSIEGGLIGTVLYISPEAAMGQPVDGRSDLYSLGVLLYEMVTSQLPFTAEEPLAVISQHLYAPVIPPRALKPDIPAAIDELIVQLLSKRPDDRPASAGEVCRILDVLDNLSLIDDQVVAANAQKPEIEPTKIDRLVRGRLVGRAKELEEMISAWKEALSGGSSTLLISGEPGIGKTRLVHELIAHATVTGGKTLAGECYAEGAMPYAPFAQMIQDSFNGHLPALHLPNDLLADLSILAPELRRQYPDLALNPAADPISQQQRIFESAIAWLSALCNLTPILLFIDDVHWADSGSLALLRHLARRGRKLRLLIVATYREVELDEVGGLQALLYDLHRERLSSRIKLTRFNREQTRQMLETMLNPNGEISDSLVDAIYRETEGNPFFIEEVTKALIEDGKLCYEDVCWISQEIDETDIPQSVRVTIQSRLSRLPAETQDVLRIAAIIGREFDFETLKLASEIEEDTLIDAIETAERAQIVSEVNRRRSGALIFSFAHALIPSTLRDGISSLRKQRMHRKVAAALESVHANDGQLEALAYHYEEAGEAEKAEDYYRRAGDRALAVFANQEAERLFHSALELSSNPTDQAYLSAHIGEARFRQGRFGEAVRSFREAIRRYRESGNYDQVAKLYARSARAAWYDKESAEGLALCLEGMEVVTEMAGPPETLESPGVVSLIHETARAYRFNNQPEQALPLCRQALAAAERLGLVEVQADSLATLGILRSLPEAERLQMLNQAVEISESADLLVTAVRAHTNLGEGLMMAGRLKESRDQYIRAYELSKKIGSTDWELNQLISACSLNLQLGEYAEIEEKLIVMNQLLNALQNPPHLVALVHAVQADLLRFLGKLEEAIGILKQCQVVIRQNSFTWMLPDINLDLADIQIELGQFSEAEQALREALAAREIKGNATEALAQLCLAIVDSYQGRQEEAENNLHAAKDLIEKEAWTTILGWFYWAEGMVASHHGDWERSIKSFDQAARLARRFNQRWYLGRALVDQADVHLSRHQGDDIHKANQLLDEARLIFRELNVPYYEQIAAKI